jgi:hypothetical protein
MMIARKLRGVVLSHVFYRYGDLEHAIPLGRKAMEFVLELIKAERPEARPTLVLTST